MNIKKFLWVLILPLVIGGCFGSGSLSQITVDDKNENFNFDQGQKFQIVLPANHTTGYQWEVKDATEGALEYLGSAYRLSDKYNQDIVGVGGEETLTFKVLEVKRSHVVLEYRRSWDKFDIANKFLVTINGNPGDDGLLTYLGTIYSTSEGDHYDDFFKVEDEENAEEFGIEPILINKIPDPGVVARIAEYKDTDTVVEIRGKMMEDVPDYGGKQFIIHEINFASA